MKDEVNDLTQAIMSFKLSNDIQRKSHTTKNRQSKNVARLTNHGKSTKNAVNMDNDTGSIYNKESATQSGTGTATSKPKKAAVSRLRTATNEQNAPIKEQKAVGDDHWEEF